MPQTYLCFLWHMHQPFYKDLVTREYKLPWTRLHALKDYYGMVRILAEFPRIRQTFNLVPSMLVQVEEYAAGQAADPFLELALRPAESLSETEQDLLLRHSFYAHPVRMIGRYPRYQELYEAWRAHQGQAGARRHFGPRDFRDLQVLSQLAWFDEEYLAHDAAVRDLAARGHDFSWQDQKLLGEKQRELIGLVIPEYRRAASAGQIEISTTPFYHPILPLLCDSDIGGVSHPGVALPPRFRYPGDARAQLDLAREYVQRAFGAAPLGLWPSEGSVSDEVCEIAAAAGFEWLGTDSGVLSRSLGRPIGVDVIYRPYVWSQQDRQIHAIFRDHFLSDLIGFVYANMEAGEAAEDFLRRIRDNCRPILAGGRDALVPIVLDGENAWEYYDRNGRQFLRELYRRVSEDPRMTAVTVGEAVRRLEAAPLPRMFPGSWINANFDVWIGAEEDNEAWTYLLRARQAYAEATGVPEDKRRLAYQELLIAEGSDWCWWYGPEHDSANRPDFDQLYREHLANVYRFLGLAPPEELSRSILRLAVREFHNKPTGAIRPVIDGEVTSYFEWIGAGSYRVDERSGSMHGRKPLVQEVQYGSDGQNLFLRIDFHPGAAEEVSDMEARFNVQTAAGLHSAALALERGGPRAILGNIVAECALRRILELRIPLAALGADSGAPVKFQFSLWQGGLPMDAVPQHGWLELASTDPSQWE